MRWTAPAALSAADELRKAYKLDEAIQSYKDILASYDVTSRTKQEAEYNLGLCYYWKDRELAEDIFTGLIEKYPDDNEMAAYCELQEAEFASEADGYTATRHQREVGTGYFDAVSMAISGGASSTTAMGESTETAQCTEDENAARAA